MEVVVQGENGRQVGQGVCEADRSRMRAASRDRRLSKVPSLPIEEDLDKLHARIGARRQMVWSETGSHE